MTTDYSIYIFPIVTGVVIAIITQVVAHFLSKRNLNAQREHSLKLASMQLHHKDRTEAFLKLDEVIKKTYKSFSEFQKAVNEFLNGSSGLFLPEKLVVDLRKELSDIDHYLTEKEYEIMGPPPEYPEEEYQEWMQSLDPFEEVDMEVKNKLSTLKRDMKDKIKKNISEGY